MPSDAKGVRARVLEMARKDERRGDWKSAMRRYRRLTGLDPDDPALHVKLGDVCIRLRQTSDAAEAFSTAGELFARKAFDEKAAARYRRALELDPGQADVRAGLIDSYRRLDRIPEAIGILERASAQADQRGDLAEALELRRQIAELDPLAVETRLRLARDLESIGRRGEALHEYVESLLELLRQRSFERARAIFDAIETLRPAAVGGGDGADVEDTGPAVDRLVSQAREARVHQEGVQDLYRRVSLLYHRERGLP
jgi:tetratricopeptide (TPR) repeat protein